MLIIKHRVNTIKEMLRIPKEIGIEVDIRSYKNELILNHEPYIEGEKLSDFLDKFENQFIILNVKEEGLEERLIKLLRLYKIERYFFLDQSFPFLIKSALNGEKNCAVRFSEYESVNTVFSLANIVDWVWVDFFNIFPLDNQIYVQLKKSKFKICLVSPELQGYENNVIINLQNYLEKNKIYIDAVCTKHPKLWDKPILFTNNN